MKLILDILMKPNSKIKKAHNIIETLFDNVGFTIMMVMPSRLLKNYYSQYCNIDPLTVV